MRPKELSFPFPFEERRVVFKDRILFVPDFFEEREKQIQAFTFPPFSDPLVFGNRNPVFVEYCSGNGLWIAEKAKQNPHINWIAVEKNFKRVKKIVSKIRNHALQNLIVIWGEAHLVTKSYFQEKSVSQVFVNFPDPWPKTRHSKFRLVNQEFAEVVRQTLQENGTFTFVTDDEEYGDEGAKALLSVFEPVFPPPYFVTEFLSYGVSSFEKLWRDKGKEIRYYQFKR
jgi:tRNA (guanine-N7-)-methyltransferase